MGVTITVNQNGLQEATANIQGFANKSVDLSTPMKQASVLMMRSIQQNFDSSGRPSSWVPLAASTIRQKIRLGYSTKPLIRTGTLRQSIASQADRMSMRLGTMVSYARYHQFGTKTIPARPYLRFQTQDLDRIRDMIIQYLTGPTNG